MWKQYLHYGGHKKIWWRTRKRHEKMKFFQGLAYEGPVFTKTVITLSFRVCFGPTGTQYGCDVCGDLENTSSLHRRPGGTSNSAPKKDFLPLKFKEHHFLLLFKQVSEPTGTPLEGNPRDYGEYKH